MGSIPAVYEGGVFRPLRKVKLEEHTEVEVITRSKEKVVDKVAGKWDFIESTEDLMKTLRKGWAEWKS